MESGAAFILEHVTLILPIQDVVIIPNGSCCFSTSKSLPHVYPNCFFFFERKGISSQTTGDDT